MSRPDGYLVPGFLDADAVVAEVARGFKVSVAEIMGDSRERHVSVARACAMAVIRGHTGWSLPTIGRYFGKDHTAVSHNVKRVNSDPFLAQAVRLVVEELEPPPRLFALPGEAV